MLSQPSAPASEPMTMATDYVLGAVACVLARRLGSGNPSRAAAAWAAAFVVAGAAAFAGGTQHGMGGLLPAGLAHGVRVASVMSVGIASASLLAGAAVSGLRPGVARRFLLALLGAKLAAYLAWVAVHPHFRYAAYASVPDGLLLLAFLARRWARGDAAARSGLVGIVLSLAGAAVQRSDLALHPVWFNHNDLCHVIQTAALWFVYRAGLALQDAR